MLPVVFSTVLLASIAAAQPSTNATCSSSFAWSFNSLRQSPCLIAAYLASVCDDGLFMVPALVDNLSYYNGPSVAQANACACSSVFYSLLSACAECQSGQVLTWKIFTTSCNTVYSQVYPRNIPLGTTVPHWAYQDVTVDEGFNSTLAQLQLDAPESTENPQATQTALPSVIPSVAAAPKRLNVKDVVGGVVGGITVLLVFCIAAFLCIRRRRKAVASSKLVQTPTPYPSTAELSHFSTIQKPKFYNPADSSTFPLLTFPDINAGRVKRPLFFGNTVTDQPPRYTGAPEV
ncbi:hypothetical protein MVEN_00210100 [Mycena venus]|uniref:Transmembrane protein n=1 Tax=Mycena venus TaxID=2733690 RepID=A0A8H7DDD6_9AGAR|nr:hypothetical protein MVEN_00210100 [Mycena venus]